MSAIASLWTYGGSICKPAQRRSKWKIPGLLKAADGGTLFLDEIAELGLDEQAMLLRAIEEKRFMPMGSDREAKRDFQLIAGSNRDLQAAAQSGVS
jgi:transcriptional regulatory protein RtcR